MVVPATTLRFWAAGIRAKTAQLRKLKYSYLALLLILILNFNFTPVTQIARSNKDNSNNLHIFFNPYFGENIWRDVSLQSKELVTKPLRQVLEPRLTDVVITKFESHVLSHSSLAVSNFILTAQINPISDHGHFCAVA